MTEKDITKNIENSDTSDRVYGIDWGFFLVTIILVCFGLVMVYSSSSVEAASSSMYNYNGYYYFTRQLRGVAIGLAGIFIIMKIKLENIKKLALPSLLISILLLVLVLFIGVERNGAVRWIEIAGFSLQPSELCKVSLVLFMASYLSESKKRIYSFWLGVVPLLFVGGIIFVLVEKQPDLGTVIAIGLGFMFMLYLAGIRRFYLISMSVIACSVGTVLIMAKPYRMARMMSFMDPWKAPETAGFQIIQSLLAIGSGGLWGAGFGQSRQKLFYLPEQHTDFIFAIIGEELGFAGVLFTILLFLIFAYLGFKIALSRKDLFSYLVAAGLTGSIVIQAFVNMGVASGILPLTGMTLPFISFGSTSMIISLWSAGIILNISASPTMSRNKKKSLPVRRKTSTTKLRKSGKNMYSLA